MNEENLHCDICLSVEWEDDDQIIQCERCFAAAHQLCYKKEIELKIPEDDWICARCRVMESDPNLEATKHKCGICL